MSAQLRLYDTEDCNDELTMNLDGTYNLQLGLFDGVDGRYGSIYRKTLYVKNTGNRAAFNTYIYPTDDIADYIKFDTDFLGDFQELETKTFEVSIATPRNSAASDYKFSVVLDYYTLPDLDEFFHNPYTDEREVAS